MQEFFFTLLSMWVIFKLFETFSSRGKNAASSHEQQQRKDDDVRINSTKSNTSKFSEKEGEYVDYEEIKD